MLKIKGPSFLLLLLLLSSMRLVIDRHRAVLTLVYSSTNKRVPCFQGQAQQQQQQLLLLLLLLLFPAAYIKVGCKFLKLMRLHNYNNSEKI